MRSASLVSVVCVAAALVFSACDRSGTAPAAGGNELPRTGTSNLATPAEATRLGALRADAMTSGFELVDKPLTFEFPRDHGPHPAFRHEWWYVTGHLDATSGERFGFELTFFRFALAPPTNTSSGEPPTPPGADGYLTSTASREPLPTPRVGEGRPAFTASVEVATPPAANGRPTSKASTAPPRSAWRTRQVYMAHFAVTDLDRNQFHSTERFARDALAMAGAQAAPFRVWLDDWSLGAPRTKAVTERQAKRGVATRADHPRDFPLDRTTQLPLDRTTELPPERTTELLAERARERGSVRPSTFDTYWQLRAADANYSFDLQLRPMTPPILNGDAGLSQKSDRLGAASYYYSMPRLAVRGRVEHNGKPLDVHGLAWLDREWGSGSLGSDQQGWDWFALQLDDGSTLMFYALRKRNGQRDAHSTGTWFTPDGIAHALANSDVQIEVKDYWQSSRGGRYPARWQLRVPSIALNVDIQPRLADQELDTNPRYWEGAATVKGTRAGQNATGKAYVELVGYATIRR